MHLRCAIYVSLSALRAPRVGMSGVRTVAQVAKLSAREMRRTSRVGDPSEDATMAKARPILAKINAAGFVTVDSQMGKKEQYNSVFHKGFVSVEWQRSYIEGFMARDKAQAFMLRMDLVGGAAVYVCEHASRNPSDKVFGNAYRVPVTRHTEPGGTFRACTRQPMLPRTLHGQWVNLLPETKLRSDAHAMEAVAPEVVQVTVVDMQWGRPVWLFNKVVDALSGRGPTSPP